MSEYLQRNSYIDTAVQKAVSGFSWVLRTFQYDMAPDPDPLKKKKKKDHVVFLDLANAFGSIPHNLLWAAFNFFYIPETITTLVNFYIQYRSDIVLWSVSVKEVSPYLGKVHWKRLMSVNTQDMLS